MKTQSIITNSTFRITTNVDGMRQVAQSNLIGAVAVVLLTLLSTVGQAFGQGNPRLLAGSTPGLAIQGQDLGPEDPQKEVEITVVLKRHNETMFQQVLQQLYTAGSPLFHRWLTMEQYAANFAPTAADVKTVSDFLATRSLSIVRTDDFNAYVIARGTVANVENAFHVEINRFSLNGSTYHANTNDVSLDEPISGLVSAVTGLDNVGFESQVRQPINPSTGQPPAPIYLEDLPPGGFINACFGVPEEDTFHTGSFWPFFNYTGQKYDANAWNLTGGTRCAYTPHQVQDGYGLTAVYGAGNDAHYQGIGIVVAYGSPTIAADESYFAGNYGLTVPRMDIHWSGNLTLNVDWALETTLDVEYASAMAPGALIDLWIASDPSGLPTTLLDAVQHHCDDAPCVNQISNSWGSPESLHSANELNFIDSVAQQASLLGISLQFSSGDDGDFQKRIGKVDVEAPASDPLVTAVGGTSLVMNSDDSILFQTGWGTNLTQIASNSFADDPPEHLGFQAGAGGGTSSFFVGKLWQQGCFGITVSCGRPGVHRKVPDIALLADPYTGVQIIHTEDFDSSKGRFVVDVTGGTSLATPMFSGVWALANEYYADQIVNTYGASLGPAAVYGYWDQKYYPAAIKDISESSFSNREGYNVTGCEHRLFKKGCHPNYSAGYLIDATGPFVSAIMAEEPTAPRNWYVVGFGTDSSLHTGVGWDPVTGVGVPNGMEFLTGIAKYYHH